MNNEVSIDKLRDEYVRKGPYELEPLCDLGLFASEEVAVIKKYGHWFEAMHKDKVPIVTDKQKMFINSQKFGVEPKGLYGRLWYRYRTACENIPF